MINYRMALFIGLFQFLALVPGTSRSGATILGAMLIGCSRTVAAEFTFFLVVPNHGGSQSRRVAAPPTAAAFPALKWEFFSRAAPWRSPFPCCASGS